MKVLVVNYEFPPVGGGGGRAAEDVCHGLAARGHQIVVHTTHLSGLPRFERRDGFAIVRQPCGRRRADRCTVREMALYVLCSALPAIRLARRWRPDVMHVHFAVPSGVVAYAVHRATGVPYLLTAHLGDVPGGVPDQTDHLFRVLNPLVRPVWRGAARATAVSEFVRDLAERAYQVPLVTVPNGVALSAIRPAPVAPAQPIRLLFAGRFNTQKNLPFLLDALAAVADLPWRLDLLGDGDQLGLVQARARALGLSDRVTFHGWVAASRVAECMQASDVLLLPSTSEGLPVVGVQALGFGLAIAASAVGGNRDVARDGENGVTFAPDDVAACVAALRRLLADPARLAAMKAASRRLAPAFDLPGIVTRYEALLAASAATRAA